MHWPRFFIFGSLSLAVFLSSIFFVEASSLKAFSPPSLFEFTRRPSGVSALQEKNRLHIETNNAQLTEIQFSGKDLIRLDEKTNIDIYFLDNGIQAQLLDGNLWASRLRGDPEMTIKVGDITVFPSKGSGSVRSEGQQIEASFSPLFVTKGNVSNIPSLIIFPFESAKGGKLIDYDIEGRPCGSVGCKNFHPWFQKNEKLDKLLLDKMNDDLRASIEIRGANFLHVPGFLYRVKNSSLAIRNLFSLRQNVEQKSIADLADMLLEDVFYFSSVNDQSEADNRFSLAASLKTDIDFWKAHYRFIAWISGNDALASFRDAFRYEVMKLDGKEKYLLALESLGDLFQALESKDKAVFLAELKKYEAEIDNFFPGKHPYAFYKLHTILLDHLSKKYPDMSLSGAFLETVAFFENRLLEQVSSKDRQDILPGLIGSKIEIMRDVSKLLYKNESLKDLREVMLELAKETDALAVTLPVSAKARKDKEHYFTEISSILAFLNSSPLEDDDDFASLYRTFVAEQDENQKIETLLYGSLPQKELDTSHNEEIIKKDFEEIGLSVYELVIPTVPGEWYGVRNAILQNIPFKASYSVTRKAFRNIVLMERLYPFGVPLEKFKAFLLGATTPESTGITEIPVLEEKDGDTESRFEKLLKNRVIEKMKDIGLTIEADNISIIDIDKTIVGINGIEFHPEATPSDSIKISFTFQNTSDEILELRIETPMNEILVKDIFPLEELMERATLIYERAKLEQERLKEEASRTNPVDVIL